MSERLAQTDKNGLVIRPKLRDCIGKVCPVAASEGNCFTSSHHLYWPRILYLETSDLAFKFRTDRHNIVSMAHCRHNGTWNKAIHSKYDMAPIPSDDVMSTFLDESAILSICDVTATNMAHIVKQIKRQQSRQLAVKESINESLEMFQSRFYELGKKIVNFEIMPIDVVEEVIRPRVLRLHEMLPQADFGALALV